jgi:putative redox protein
MGTKVKLDRNMRIIGTDDRGHETIFDALPNVGGEDTATKPMQVLLLSMAACTAMDVISILRKKRKTVEDFWVDIESEIATEHPKVFKRVKLYYNLKSSDAEEKDLLRSIELSQDKYCAASAMFKASGCIVEFETNIMR